MRGAVRMALAAALIATPLLLAGCGERAHLPSGSAAASVGASGTKPSDVTTTSTSTTRTDTPALPTLPQGGRPPVTETPATSGGGVETGTDPTQRA
ncbi:MAG TPA: hypothetical protein VK773_03130, partial [Acidimicrobiales bacterium]|nr:hypothetical protein [Acidimicrobiales bacterium]